MTPHQSIVKKIQSGWTDDRLRQEYHWIHGQNLQAVIRAYRLVLNDQDWPADARNVLESRLKELGC